MLQNRACKRADIVHGRGEPALIKGAGAGAEHQRLSGARSRTPGNMARHALAVGLRSRRADELQNGADHAFAHRHLPDQPLDILQTGGVDHRTGLGFAEPGGFDQDAPLILFIRIADIDLHQKAVELGFGQRVGAFLLQRVLGGKHVEGGGQIEPAPGNGNVIFLHGLQQGGLGAGRGPVDLVGHQQLREDRAFDKAEGAAPVRILFQNFRTQNIRRHQVRGELNAGRAQAKRGAKGGDKLGLGKARNTDEQRMAAGEQRDERVFHRLFLTENHLAHFAANAGDIGQRLFGQSHHLIFAEGGVSAGHCIHVRLLRLRPLANRHAPGLFRFSAYINLMADKLQSNDYLKVIEMNRDHIMAERKEAEGAISAVSDAAGLAALIQRASADKNAGKDTPPPVERWNPPFCGDLDMEIRADGTWFYLGTPIGRAPLVRLFSTVLRKDEDGKTYLVTPVEKVGIRVVDAPFVAVEMQRTEDHAGQVLTFRTNVGDVVAAGPQHPLRFVIHGENRELKPYLHVRGRLEALVSRAVMYDLVALGEVVDVDGTDWFAIRSGGAVFPVMPEAELSALAG